MDAGPVLAQKDINIPAHISKQQLADQLHKEGAKITLEILQQIASNTAKETAQVESEATFCSTIKKHEGKIDWLKPALEIEREVRAYAGWPTSYFELNNNRYVVTSVETAPDMISETPGTMVLGNKTFGVQCGKGVVWITSIQPAGKKEMPIAAFLNGYRTKLSGYTAG
jgi:methionyl-tRNA formyltransferase